MPAPFNDTAYVLNVSVRIQVKRLMTPRMTLAAIIEKLPNVVPEAVMAAYDDLIMDNNDH
jgi:hypothetical protein